jgi:hypothetical protein
MTTDYKGRKSMRGIWVMVASVVFLLTAVVGAQAGPIDPNCTPGKAAKGAAQRATVGVGNRCKAGETARDTLGVDNKKKKNDGNGSLKKNKD